MSYTLVDGATDWTAPASYKDATAAPGAGDVVIVPAKATVYLNCSSDAASLDVVKKLRNIYLTSDDSRIEIKVDGTDEVEIPVSMSAYQFSGKTLLGTYDYMGGPIVKKGTGTLKLTSCGFHGVSAAYDYYAALDVEEGTLRILNGYGGKSSSGLGRVKVNAGATLFVPYSASKSDGGNNSLMSIAGGGCVTSDVATVLYFVGYKARGDAAEFSGSFGGPIAFCFAANPACDAQSLTGRSYVDYSGSGTWILGKQGRIGYGNMATSTYSATAFGWYTKDENLWFKETGFTLEYVGNQPLATRQGFVFSGPGSAPDVFDAGAFGGVTFNGQWQRLYSSPGGVNVVLTGSNTVPCVLNNAISDNTDSEKIDGRGHTLYIAKEGSGTWRINNYENDNGVNRKSFASGFSVNEGVLQYDELANKGQVCALGVGTNLTDGTLGKADTNAEHRVAYGVRFGAPKMDGSRATSGRLEYVNNRWHGSTTNREFALDGAGGFTANCTTAAVIYAGGVYSISPNAAVLHLDGTSTVENAVMNISDGTSPVSVTKAGSGTWALGGNLTFTGDITVKGGTLILRKPQYYTWYRWTVTGLWGTTDNFQCYHELGYFDKDGNNQVLDYCECTNAHRVMHAGSKSYADFMLLQPGSAQHHCNGNFYAFEGSGASAGHKLTLDRAFDGEYAGTSTWGVKYKMLHMSTGKDSHPVPDDPNTWMPLTVRMKEDAHEVTGFDFANVYGLWSASGALSCISNCTVEASLDGLKWDVLTNLTGAARHYDGGMWSCQGGYTDGEETHNTRKTDSFPNRNAHYAAYPLAGHPETLPQVNDPAGFVSVSGGGTLKMDKSGGATAITISKLRVAGGGAGGTIDGFTLAQKGTLDVPDLSTLGRDCTLPLAFVDTAGVANVSGWTLTADGGPTLSRHVAVKDGKLRIVAMGTVLIVR